MSLTDRELWVCTGQVMSGFGAGAADHAIDRLVDAARRGDQQAVATWQCIAERVAEFHKLPGADTIKH